MEKRENQRELRTELNIEWLDETGGIPDVSGWLDETDTLPKIEETENFLDETMPLVTREEDEGEEPFSDGETPFLPDEGWEEETEEESVSDSEASEFADETAPMELMVSDWEDERESYPRIYPGDWDDNLDEEPEDWYVSRPSGDSIHGSDEPMRGSGLDRLDRLDRYESAEHDSDADEAELPVMRFSEADDEDSDAWDHDDFARGSEDAEEAEEAVKACGEETANEDALPAEEGSEAAENREQENEGGSENPLLNRLQHLTWMDAAAALLAVAIGAALIMSSVSYAGSRKILTQRTALAQAGAALTEAQVLHTDAIDQIAQVRMEQEEQQAAEEEAARKKAEEEAQLDEEEGSVTVEVVLSTIQSDLKIKIRRKKEQSLIGGVPFTIKVKGPDGKTTEQKDTDEDGIVYLTGLSSGKYEVTLCQLIDIEAMKAENEDYREDEDYLSYSKYKISDTAQSIEVTDNIAYEVVDVSDEVKSASEVNAAKEDTAKNDTPVESKITDTVEWVESTKTEIDGGSDSDSYEEVKKSDVSDPYASSALRSTEFRKLSEVTTESSENGESTSESSSESGSENSQGSSSDGSNENTEEKKEDSSDAGSGNADEENPELSVDPSEIHLTEGKTQTIKATVSHASDTTVSYSSSDTSVATVSDGGTVQGVKAGSCTITVTLKNYSDVSKKVSVTVTEKTDDSTPLKDSSGNPLYVKDGDSYRAATAADYSRYDTFYRKKTTEKKYKYTGWQHINGLTYYYDKNGDYVTGTQIIQGVSYTFSSEGILDTGSTNTGIDVSMWNGSINWSEVASSGISFAIVRCGYRGSSTGALVKDSKVGTNVTGARNAGLKVGLYFFSQAINEAEAVEEASMAVQIAKSYGISMPIFLDVESSGGRGDSISVSQRTANIVAFCRTVQNAGLSAGVYANTNWFSEKINVSSLTSYHIWLAQYAASPTYSRSRYDIWQYSSTGRVNGISGDVDLDISYRSY